MAASLIKALARAGIFYGIAQILLRGESSRHHVEQTVVQLATRVALAVAAISLGFVALLLFAVALFFFLAGELQFVRPAVITAGVVAVIAVLLFMCAVARSRR